MYNTTGLGPITIDGSTLIIAGVVIIVMAIIGYYADKTKFASKEEKERLAKLKAEKKLNKKALSEKTINEMLEENKDEATFDAAVSNEVMNNELDVEEPQINSETELVIEPNNEPVFDNNTELVLENQSEEVPNELFAPIENNTVANEELNIELPQEENELVLENSMTTEMPIESNELSLNNLMEDSNDNDSNELTIDNNVKMDTEVDDNELTIDSNEEVSFNESVQPVETYEMNNTYVEPNENELELNNELPMVNDEISKPVEFEINTDLDESISQEIEQTVLDSINAVDMDSVEKTSEPVNTTTETIDLSMDFGIDNLPTLNADKKVEEEEDLAVDDIFKL